MLRGLDLLYRVEDDPWRKALPLFERAIALDPRYAAAYALAATCHGERFYEGTSADPTADHMEAERLSRLALSYDRFDPLALSLCGHIRSWLFHDYDHAIELFDRALAANPSAAIAWARSSATFSYIGETREARRRVEIGLRLSPYDAHVFFSYGLAGLAAYAGGDYAEAASWGRRAMTLNPRFVGNLRFLAASLAASGQFKEAHEVGRALLRVNPSVQRRQVRGRACVQGCRQAAAVRRAPGAGGAAGVARLCWERATSVTGLGKSIPTRDHPVAEYVLLSVVGAWAATLWGSRTRSVHLRGVVSFLGCCCALLGLT